MIPPNDKSFIDLGETFWQTTPLDKLTNAQWEALCDGCAKCCLHKVMDEDDEVHYTDLHCHLLNQKSCRCGDYLNRHLNVPDCIAFNSDDIESMDWLPDTCAYRLRFHKKPLHDWHYLISGYRKSIHEAGESLRDFGSPFDTRTKDIPEEHILHFRP